jgi:hypothetical protein
VELIPAARRLRAALAAVLVPAHAPRLVLAFDGPNSPCIYDNPPFRLFRVRVTNTSTIEIRDVGVRLKVVPGHPAMSPPEFQVMNQRVGTRTITLGPGDTRYFDILSQHHPETGLGAVVWGFADKRISPVQLDAYRPSYTFELIVASLNGPPTSKTFTVEFQERILVWRRS